MRFYCGPAVSKSGASGRSPRVERSGQGNAICARRTLTISRARSRSFEAIATYTASPDAVAGGSEPVRTTICQVSADFFRVLGVTPVMGRVFSGGRRPRGSESAMASGSEFWKARGRIWKEPHSVSRIAASRSSECCRRRRNFRPALMSGIRARFIRRMNRAPAHNFRVIARLRPGVSFEQANAEVGAIGREMKAEYGIADGRGEFRPAAVS